MKSCPYCAEKIQDKAVFCRYCNKEIPVSEEIQSTPVKLTKWNKKRIFLTISLCCIGLLMLCCAWWLFPSIKTLLSDSEDDVKKEIFQPEDFFILTPNQDSFSRISPNNLAQLTLVRHCGHTDIQNIKFSPTNDFIIQQSTHGFSIYDLNNYENNRSIFSKQESHFNSIDVSLDGNHFASTDGNDIYVWNISGDLENGFNTYVESLGFRLVKFSPNGKTLATVTYSEEVHIWEISSGEQLIALDLAKYIGNSHVDSLKFSPDGTSILFITGGKGFLWHTDQKEPILIFDSDENIGTIRDAFFSEDGKRIIIMGLLLTENQEYVRFLDPSGLMYLEFEIKENFYSISKRVDLRNTLSKNPPYPPDIVDYSFVPGTNNIFILEKVLDPETDLFQDKGYLIEPISGEIKMIYNQNTTETFSDFQISNKGKYLLTVSGPEISNRYIQVHDLENNSEIYKSINGRNYIDKIQFSMDGKIISRNEGILYSISDCGTSNEISPLNYLPGKKSGLVDAISIDGKYSFIDYRKNQKLWDNFGNQLVKEYSDDEINFEKFYIFLNDGKFFYNSNIEKDSRTISIYRSEDGELTNRFNSPDPHNDKIGISPDNHYFLYLDGHFIRVWDILDNKPVTSIEIDSSGSIDFFLNNTTLFVGTAYLETKKISLFSLPKGNLLKEFQIDDYHPSNSSEPFTISPDQSLIAYKSSAGFTVREIDDASNIKKVDSNTIRSLEFSPDGSLLAASSGDAIFFWGVK